MKLSHLRAEMEGREQSMYALQVDYLLINAKQISYTNSSFKLLHDNFQILLSFHNHHDLGDDLLMLLENLLSNHCLCSGIVVWRPC